MHVVDKLVRTFIEHKIPCRLKRYTQTGLALRACIYELSLFKYFNLTTSSWRENAINENSTCRIYKTRRMYICINIKV